MSTKKKGIFTPVERKNEMDHKMTSEIEKNAKECVESTKENFKGIIELPAEIKLTSGSSCWVCGKYNVTVQVE